MSLLHTCNYQHILWTLLFPFHFAVRDQKILCNLQVNEQVCVLMQRLHKPTQQLRMGLDQCGSADHETQGIKQDTKLHSPQSWHPREQNATLRNWVGKEMSDFQRDEDGKNKPGWFSWIRVLCVHCLGAQSASQALTPSAQTRDSFLKKLPEKPTQLALEHHYCLFFKCHHLQSHPGDITT